MVKRRVRRILKCLNDTDGKINNKIKQIILNVIFILLMIKYSSQFHIIELIIEYYYFK